MDEVQFRCLECDCVSGEPELCPMCGSDEVVPEWEDGPEADRE